MLKISFQDVFQVTDAEGQIKVGQRASTPDGNIWVYGKSNGGSIAAFKVAVPGSDVAFDTASSSADNQGRNVYITEASAGWTVGAYANYWGVVDDGTGVGQRFRVQTNSTDTLTLYPEYALSTALAVADSDITLSAGEASLVIAAITSKLQNAVGIAQTAFTDGDFGWFLEKGRGSVFAGEVLTKGAGYTTGDDTTGQVINNDATESAVTAQILGRTLVANAGADQRTLVWVNVN